MNDVTRRNAMKMLAGGTVLASGSLAATARPEPSQSAVADPMTTPVDPVVLQADTGCAPPATSPVLMARVSRCRAWSGSVYLDAGPGLRGYAQVAPQAFAIAAACQAADRPVAMRHLGHEPRWAAGAGRFAGVVLAVDRQDLDAREDDQPWA